MGRLGSLLCLHWSPGVCPSLPCISARPLTTRPRCADSTRRTQSLLTPSCSGIPAALWGLPWTHLPRSYPPSFMDQESPSQGSCVCQDPNETSSSIGNSSPSEIDERCM